MYADFQGSNPNPLGSTMAGAQFVESLHERNQRLRLETERQQLAQQQAEILRPALEAKAKADIATANAEIEGVRQTETARAGAMEILPTARAEFDKAMTIADPLERSNAMATWAGRYSHLSALGPLSAEFDSKSKLAAKLIEDGLHLHKIDATVKGQIERAKLLSDASRFRSMPAVQKLQALRDEAAQLGDQDAIDVYDKAIAKATYVAPPKTDSLGTIERAQARIQEEEALAQEAEATGDTEAAAFHRQQAATYKGFVSLRTERQSKGSLKDEVLKRLGAAKPPASNASPTTTPAAATTPPATVDTSKAIEDLKW
ncbi:hypothetical protein [Nibricoccus sp. IMCC34717]|uniref:hypothetical protein n=1 Tax=Nibricoccus sp. IMCC34717 TaxID=3034021 RepID=UPI00384D7318